MDANVDMFSIMMNEEDMINHESDDEYDASWQESIPKTNGNVQRGATSEGILICSIFLSFWILFP